ncbi:MAG TPA: CPBP family intramembrane glutamic endopeptidase, partial [Chryseolinea sp.]|nr:CPBP family intramembrane glutamic endopeptidase [Chryseolinea sp.]
VTSILISSALFGVVHLNPWQFISALIIGIFSGWVYYKTKNLTLSILIHFVNNLAAFSSMYFLDAEVAMDMPLSEQYGGFLNLVMITFGAIVVAVICLYFLRLEIITMKTNYSVTQHNI